MALRRHSPSPYEVMYNKSTNIPWMTKGNGAKVDCGEVESDGQNTVTESQPAAGPVEPTNAEASVLPAEHPGGGPPGEALPWWRRVQQPIVLRLPQGAVVLMGVAVVGLIVLAYWVGHQRAGREGQGLARLATGVPAAGVISETPLVVSEPEVALPEPGNQVVPEASMELGRTDRDPRQEEYNYFVLAHYPQAEAGRLVEFLVQQGVDAAAFRADGGKLYQVVALRGFRKEELGGQEYESYKQRLLSLGRQWHPQGFTGIFASRYKGEPAQDILIVGFKRESSS